MFKDSNTNNPQIRHVSIHLSGLRCLLGSPTAAQQHPNNSSAPGCPAPTHSLPRQPWTSSQVSPSSVSSFPIPVATEHAAHLRSWLVHVVDLTEDYDFLKLPSQMATRHKVFHTLDSEPSFCTDVMRIIWRSCENCTPHRAGWFHTAFAILE